MSEEISDERKAAYYLGIALTACGMIVFGINLFVHATAKNQFDVDAASMAGWALGSMAVCVVGGILINIGKAGAAGAGLILDPKQAREDLEPYSRMAGGMVKDAIDEAGLAGAPLLSGREQDTPAQQEIVKVRCRGCCALNDEEAKFCNQCGAPL